MSEWPNEPVSKTGVPVRAPRVQIPFSAPNEKPVLVFGLGL